MDNRVQTTNIEPPHMCLKKLLRVHPVDLVGQNFISFSVLNMKLQIEFLGSILGSTGTMLHILFEGRCCSHYKNGSLAKEY